MDGSLDIGSNIRVVAVFKDLVITVKYSGHSWNVLMYFLQLLVTKPR